MGNKSLINALTYTLIVFSMALVGCTSGGDQQLLDASSGASYAAKPANLRVSLIDAPTDLKEVNVNIDYIELYFQKDNKKAKVRLSEGLGMVDLLKLQDGIQLFVGDLDVPAEVSISKVRLILKHDGHYAVKLDDSICTMQTPSAQQTGLKINLKQPVTFETNHSYSMVIDFDAKKSVVVKGNGDCLLKPVLKLPSFTKIPLVDVPDEGGTPDDGSNEDPVTDGEDDNSGDAGDDGYDVGTCEVDNVDSPCNSDTGGATDDASGSDSVDTGTTGDESDGTGDYVPIDPDQLVNYF